MPNYADHHRWELSYHDADALGTEAHRLQRLRVRENERLKEEAVVIREEARVADRDWALFLKKT